MAFALHRFALSDDFVTAGQAKQELVARAKAALEKRTPQLRKVLRDNTAKLVPLGLVVRGHMMRSENVQAVNATGTYSVTLQGAEHILSRPAHMAITRIQPDKLVFVYFFGAFDEQADSKKYEAMMRGWLIDFDRTNNKN